MPFKQGVKPCLVLPKGDQSKFRARLRSLGYKVHQGLRTTRKDEIRAWVRAIRQGRQVHVQEEKLDNGDIAVYAHTEPEGQTLDHLLSALFDEASFQGGAKVLLRDLESTGWAA